MIDTLISIVGLAFNLVSGIQRGKAAGAFLDEIKKANYSLEKLSDDIYYLTDVLAVRNSSTSHQSIITDLREVRKELEPIRQLTGGKLLSSSMIQTPGKMKQVLKKNPWEVLDNIRPYRLAAVHSNPDMVPVLFEDQGRKYIGWQMRSALPLLFDCEYVGFEKVVQPKEVPQLQQEQEGSCHLTIYRHKQFIGMFATLIIQIGHERVIKLRRGQKESMALNSGKKKITIYDSFSTIFDNKHTSSLFDPFVMEFDFLPGEKYYFGLRLKPKKTRKDTGIQLTRIIDPEMISKLDEL